MISITDLFSIELIEDSNDENSVEVFYRVNSVAMVGGTANVGRSAGSYVSENLSGAHEDADTGLASLVGGVIDHADPGFCATHMGMDFLSWEVYMNKYLLTADGIPALLREYNGVFSNAIEDVVKKYLFHMYNARSRTIVLPGIWESFGHLILHENMLFVEIDSRIRLREELRFYPDRETEPLLNTPEWRKWFHDSIVVGVKAILARREVQDRTRGKTIFNIR